MKNSDRAKVDTVRLQNMSRAFIGSASLFAAIDLELFTCVAEGDNTVDKFAVRAGITEVNADRLMTMCAASGLLHWHSDHFENEEDVQRFLVKGEKSYAAAWLTFTRPAWGDWGKLTEVGAMRVEPVAFRRGTADISDFSRVELDQMADRIQSWPTYYLRVVGHARTEGDKEANLKLAASRSIAVREYLVSQGVSENRLRAESAAELSQDAEVSFVLGHNPY